MHTGGKRLLFLAATPDNARDIALDYRARFRRAGRLRRGNWLIAGDAGPVATDGNARGPADFNARAADIDAAAAANSDARAANAGSQLQGRLLPAARARWLLRELCTDRNLGAAFSRFVRGQRTWPSVELAYFRASLAMSDDR